MLKVYTEICLLDAHKVERLFTQQHINTHSRTYTHMRAHTHTHLHAHAHTHARTRTHIYTHSSRKPRRFTRNQELSVSHAELMIVKSNEELSVSHAELMIVKSNKELSVSHAELMIVKSNACGKNGLVVSASRFQRRERNWLFSDWNLGLEFLVQCMTCIGQDRSELFEDLTLVTSLTVNYLLASQPSCSRHHCLQFSSIDLPQTSPRAYLQVVGMSRFMSLT